MRSRPRSPRSSARSARPRRSRRGPACSGAASCRPSSRRSARCCSTARQERARMEGARGRVRGGAHAPGRAARGVRRDSLDARLRLRRVPRAGVPARRRVPRPPAAAAAARASGGGGRARVLDRRRDDGRDRRRVLGARAAAGARRSASTSRHPRSTILHGDAYDVVARCGCRPFMPGTQDHDAARRRRARVLAHRRRTPSGAVALHRARRAGRAGVPSDRGRARDRRGEPRARQGRRGASRTRCPRPPHPPWAARCACCGSSCSACRTRAASRDLARRLQLRGRRPRTRRWRCRAAAPDRAAAPRLAARQAGLGADDRRDATWGELRAKSCGGPVSRAVRRQGEDEHGPAETPRLRLTHYLPGEPAAARYADLVNQRQLLRGRRGERPRTPAK